MATAKRRSRKFPPSWPSKRRPRTKTLVEMVAEGDDELMQEFFDKGTLPVEDLKKGLREAVLAKRIFPVLLSSALHNIGERRHPGFPGSRFSRLRHPAERPPATKPQITRARRWNERSRTPSRFRFSSSRRLPIRSPAASRISRSCPGC